MLEQLIRSTTLEHGRIALDADGKGGWRASICHFNGHMVHHMGETKDDPVEALRIALVEDERLCRDAARRHRESSDFDGLFE